MCLCVCMTNCTVFACMYVHGHRGSTPPCDRSAVVKPPVFKPYTGSLSPYTHTHTLTILTPTHPHTPSQSFPTSGLTPAVSVCDHQPFN